MSASVPGPKARSHASTSAGRAVRLRARLDRRAEPRRHRRPARARRGPRAGVGGPDDGAGRGQHGQHARPDRHLAGPCLAFAVRDHAVEEGHLVAQLGEGHLAAIRERRDDLRWTPSPASARRCAAGRLSRRDPPGGGAPAAATRSLAPACASASRSRGKTNSVRRIARCFTSDRSTVQRALEIGHRHAGDAGLRGQEDRRRVGAVQADHAAGRLDDIGGAVRAGQTVTPGDPGSTLGDGEAARGGHAARS